MKKYQLILIFTLLFFSCERIDSINKLDYPLMDAEINSYESATAFLKYYYEAEGYPDSSEAYRMINDIIVNINTNFSVCTKSSRNTFEENQVNKSFKKDSLLKLYLLDSYELTWNLNKCNLVMDKSYNELSLNIDDNLKELIYLIDDTSKTKAYSCSKDYDDFLKVGDISFLVVLNLKKIKMFKTFSMQFDSYSKNCDYPDSLFIWLSNNRKKVIDTLIKKYGLERG